MSNPLEQAARSALLQVMIPENIAAICRELGAAQPEAALGAPLLSPQPYHHETLAAQLCSLESQDQRYHSLLLHLWPNPCASGELRDVLVRSKALLLPSGYLIVVTHDLSEMRRFHKAYRRYGFEIDMPLNLREGEKFTYTLAPSGGQNLPSRHYSESHWFELINEVGFGDFQGFGPSLPHVLEKDYPPEYWDLLMENPPLMIIAARCS